MAVTREEIIEALKEMSLLEASEPVSYTHLDVYKRQRISWFSPAREESFVSERTQDVKSVADEALHDGSKLAELIEALSGGSRRTRQNAAQVLAAVAKERPDALVPYGTELVDALNRPEAQTRWECLDVLTGLVEFDSRACDKAVPGAETALFDEESGPDVYKRQIMSR